MKSVHSFQILGNPPATSQHPQEACPVCGGACFDFEDGSIHCTEHGSFEPEPSDLRLSRRRKEFDARLGITAADRKAVADKVAEHAELEAQFDPVRKTSPLTTRMFYRAGLADLIEEAQAVRDGINERIGRPTQTQAATA